MRARQIPRRRSAIASAHEEKSRRRVTDRRSAPLPLLREALPAMRARRWGRVVNHTARFRTMVHVLPYGATKAALECAFAIWAAERAGTGITVNLLIPGAPIDTPFIAARWSAPAPAHRAIGWPELGADAVWQRG